MPFSRASFNRFCSMTSTICGFGMGPFLPVIKLVMGSAENSTSGRVLATSFLCARKNRLLVAGCSGNPKFELVELDVAVGSIQGCSEPGAHRIFIRPRRDTGWREAGSLDLVRFSAARWFGRIKRLSDVRDRRASG